MITRILFGMSRADFDRLRPMLYRLAYAWSHDAALADDLVQETLSKSWERRAQLREEAAIKSWMVSIMNRCWLDQLRGQREFEDVDDWQDTLESGTDGPEACCNREEVIATVRAAVERLPLGQRQVLTLVDLEEFSYADVAESLDIPVGTVMSRLSRARAALRQNLETTAQQPGVQPLLRRVK